MAMTNTNTNTNTNPNITNIGFRGKVGEASIPVRVLAEEVLKYNLSHPGCRLDWRAILYNIGMRTDAGIRDNVRKTLILCASESERYVPESCEVLRLLSQRASGALRRPNVKRIMGDLMEERREMRDDTDTDETPPRHYDNIQHSVTEETEGFSGFQDVATMQRRDDISTNLNVHPQQQQPASLHHHERIETSSSSRQRQPPQFEQDMLFEIKKMKEQMQQHMHLMQQQMHLMQQQIQQMRQPIGQYYYSQ